MIPSITAVRLTGAATRAELPLLVLGPDLGTTASSLRIDCAQHLDDVFDLLAWDLPGHGYNRGVPEEGFTVAELAAGVLRVVDDVLAERGELGAPFSYAGVLAGATVGLQLCLDAPHRVRAMVAIGRPEPLPAIPAIPATPGDLGAVVAAGYDLVVAALAEHDAGDRLDELRERTTRGQVVVVETEPGLLQRDPAAVARALRQHVLGEAPPVDVGDLLAAYDGIEPATAWQRPGLDLRARHLVAVTTLVVADDLDALAPVVRAALDDGVTTDELVEIVVQVAGYVGDERAREAVVVVQDALLS